MIRQCVTCGDQAVDGKLCAFCERFGVSRSAAPNAVVRRRVMRELEMSEDRTQSWVDEAARQRDRARRLQSTNRLLLIVACMAIAFGLMMLNALPSAQAGVVDVRAERLLRAWCPASMSRRDCIGWMRVAQCETGDPEDRGVTYASLRRIDWKYNGRSGFDGGLQYSPRTWRASVGRIPARRLTRAQFVARRDGRYAFAYSAPPVVQVLASHELRVRPDANGLGQWPDCGGRYLTRG